MFFHIQTPEGTLVSAITSKLVVELTAVALGFFRDVEVWPSPSDGRRFRNVMLLDSASLERAVGVGLGVNG